jgi:hypothetical protein
MKHGDMSDAEGFRVEFLALLLADYTASITITITIAICLGVTSLARLKE